MPTISFPTSRAVPTASSISTISMPTWQGRSGRTKRSSSFRISASGASTAKRTPGKCSATKSGRLFCGRRACRTSTSSTSRPSPIGTNEYASAPVDDLTRDQGMSETRPPLYGAGTLSRFRISPKGRRNVNPLRPQEPRFQVSARWTMSLTTTLRCTIPTLLVRTSSMRPCRISSPRSARC